MEFKWTTDLSDPTYEDAIHIRKTVFVEEQKVPVELEIDELEDQTSHVVGYLDGVSMATARMYEKEPNVYKIQRVAVSKSARSKGTGKMLMAEVEAKVRSLGGKKLVLDAQDHALTFYEKSGYKIEGEGFPDAGIPHHKMTKEL